MGFSQICPDMLTCVPSALLTPSSLRLSGSVQRPLSCMESRTSCSNLNARGLSLVSQVTDGGCLASNKQTQLENQNQKARSRWWQWRCGVSSQIRQCCYVRVLPQWHFLPGQRSSRWLVGLSPGCAWEFWFASTGWWLLMSSSADKGTMDQQATTSLMISVHWVESPAEAFQVNTVFDHL